MAKFLLRVLRVSAVQFVSLLAIAEVIYRPVLKERNDTKKGPQMTLMGADRTNGLEAVGYFGHSLGYPIKFLCEHLRHLRTK